MSHISFALRGLEIVSDCSELLRRALQKRGITCGKATAENTRYSYKVSLEVDRLPTNADIEDVKEELPSWMKEINITGHANKKWETAQLQPISSK